MIFRRVESKFEVENNHILAPEPNVGGFWPEAFALRQRNGGGGWWPEERTCFLMEKKVRTLKILKTN